MAHIPLSARVKHAVANGRTSGTVWVHRTARFAVSLSIEPVHGYQYDGDDEDGSTQAALDSGEFVAFDSVVSVELDGVEIASDSLCSSVYGAERVAEFWTAHRGADPMDRNCTIMRADRDSNCCICHYFPDMVRTAIAEARDYIASVKAMPRLRAAA